ncbi:MAG TPA: hypothetical protein PLV78_13325 [Deltaproteobacteria bacterium]|nr:hypothetical protein [Deltaproteobacteria bacterium]
MVLNPGARKSATGIIAKTFRDAVMEYWSVGVLSKIPLWRGIIGKKKKLPKNITRESPIPLFP